LTESAREENLTLKKKLTAFDPLSDFFGLGMMLEQQN
jgi:hypothetical protein